MQAQTPGVDVCMAAVNMAVCTWSRKQLQNVTNPSSASFPLHFNTPTPWASTTLPTTTTTTIPTPPLGPLQPAACLWRSPLTSAARLGRVPALWALDGCGWSEKQSAVCGARSTDSTRPAQTHLMTRKHPTGPLPLPLFCLSHVLTIEGDTCEDEWFVLQMAGIINTSRRGTLWLFSGLKEEKKGFSCSAPDSAADIQGSLYLWFTSRELLWDYVRKKNI